MQCIAEYSIIHISKMDLPEYMPVSGNSKGVLPQKLKITIENNKVIGTDTLGNQYVAVVYSPNGSFISSVVNYKNRHNITGIPVDLIYQLMTDARLVGHAYQHSVKKKASTASSGFITRSTVPSTEATNIKSVISDICSKYPTVPASIIPQFINTDEFTWKFVKRSSLFIVRADDRYDYYTSEYVVECDNIAFVAS